MVEGSAGPRGLPRAPRTSGRVRPDRRRARPAPSCRAGAAPDSPAASTPDRRRARRRHLEDDADPRDPARGPARLGGARRVQPRPRRAPARDAASRTCPTRPRSRCRRSAATSATNAGGPHCLAYGVTSAHVLALDVVLSDGTRGPGGLRGPRGRRVRPPRGRRRLRRGRWGRDRGLRPAHAGAPGGPDDADGFRRPSRTARRTVSAIVAGGVVPAAIEMMDQGIVRAVEAFAHAGYPTDAAAVLLVEVDGIAARRRRAGPLRSRTPPARTASVRSGRRRRRETSAPCSGRAGSRAFGAIAQIAPHYHLHDCVVPRTKLGRGPDRRLRDRRRHGIIVTNVFHAGDGNLHPLLSFDRSEPGVLERVLRASEEIVGSASTRAGRSRASTGSGSRSATSCRSCSPRTTSPRRRACGRVRPGGRMNPQKVLPDGARCGEFAVAAGDAAGAATRLTPSRRARGSDRAEHRRRGPRGAPSRRAEAGRVSRSSAAGRTRRQGRPVRGRHRAVRPRGSIAWSRTTPRRCSAVVEAGMRIGDLRASSPKAGRSGPPMPPTTRPSAATIAAGVVLAAAAPDGSLRDTVVEMELVTRRRPAREERRPDGEERRRASTSTGSRRGRSGRSG